MLLAACSASWQAPVESRSEPPARQRGSLAGVERYRVQAGDTLYGIAWQKGVDYRSIASWNGIRPPYRIYVGQTLRLVPPPARRAPRPAKPPSTRQAQTVRSRPAAKSAPRPATAAAAESRSSRSLRWVWPATGRVVARFDADKPLGQGIKIAGADGAPINAAEGGKVVYSGSGLIGYGRLIIVKHNKNYLSAYGHNRSLLVEEGDEVSRGQKIAEMGTAGDGQPALHFEIRRDGRPVNPVRYLPKR